MKLAKALEEKMLDVRLVDRLMAEGKITKAQMDKHLADLADDEGNYERLTGDDSASASETTEQ